MTSTRKALIAAAVAVIFALGLIFWQVKARKAGPVELTAEDMALIAEEFFKRSLWQYTLYTYFIQIFNFCRQKLFLY